MRKISILICLLLAFSLGWSSVANADDSPGIVDLEGQNLQATVVVNWANLRSGPGEAYGVVGGVQRGTHLTVLALAGDVNGWYLVQLPTSQKAWVASWIVNVATTNQANMLAPAKSTLYISVDTSPGFFNRLSDLFTVFNGGNTGLGLTFQGNIERMLSLLFNNPLVTAGEVRPWLGNEVSVVNLQCLSVTMSDFLMSNALNETPRPSVVILASVVDPVGAKQFIDHVVSTGPMVTAPKRQMTYNGFTYWLMNDPNDPNYNADMPPVAMGIVGNYAVFTQGQTSYEAIIDVANGAPSLGQSQNFQDVYGGLVPNSFAKVYASPGLYCPLHEPVLYPALLNDMFKNKQIDIPGVDPNGTPEQIQQQLIQLLDNTFKGYGVGFRNTGSGVNVDLVSGVNAEKLQQLTGLTADQIKQITDNMGLNLFGFLSPQTFEALTFGNLTGDFNTLHDVQSQTTGTTFAQQTGMTSDVLNYIDGSVTMGFIDYPTFSDSSKTPNYFLMVVESSDTTKSATAYQALIDAAMKQTGATQSQRDYNGTQITRVEVPATPGSSKIAPSTAVKGSPSAQTQPKTKIIEFANIGTYTLLATGGNMQLVIDNGSKTSDGKFVNDWRLLAGLPDKVPTNGNVSQSPFIAYLDLGKQVTAGFNSRINAAAIVSPATGDQTSSRITIICRICRRGDTCWTNHN